MKKVLLIVLLFAFQFSFAQSKGTVTGKLTDKDLAGEALPFANVLVKGTSIGSTTDMDGNYTLSVPSGAQTIVFSFIGYETKEEQVNILADQTITLNKEMGASEGEQLEEVIIKTSVNRESETALLVDQKKAIVVKESIGAQELAKKGVSDASGATEKIAGVTKSESSGDLYIRGLGDRYLSTSMNGLPIPSDDVNKKNIDLGLFSTNVIQNVGISKTFTASNFADQASGNVDIQTKKYSKDAFKVSASYGINTNVVSSDFRVTANNDNQTLGFFDSDIKPANTISNGNWDALKKQPFGNYGITLSGAKKFDLSDEINLKITGSASHANKSEYTEGIFQEYQSNTYKRDFLDVERFSTTKTTTGLLDFTFKAPSAGQEISLTSLFVNKGVESLYEQGRSGQGRVLDQFDENSDFGSFARDQNFKQTLIWVGQLHGKHRITDNNQLVWAGGYNYVKADEPNRIRNEVNIHSVNEIEVLSDGGFEQRKSSQDIKDNEVNFSVKDIISFPNLGEDNLYKLSYGFDFREKDRDFSSQFFGVSKAVNNFIFADNIDALSQILNDDSINNGDFEIISQKANTYDGKLNIKGLYADFSFGNEDFTGNVGARYEVDKINVNWDVNNFGIGGTSREYKSFLPSVNLKYAFNDKHSLRFASSVTNTLPEFKEFARFVYISPSGRGTIGNEDLDKSDNYNIDLKYEVFPSRKQLISVAAFYKQILNPINKTIEKGSTGYITYANTGNKAEILGLELEGKLSLFDLLGEGDREDELSTTFNFTYMYTNQDLLEEFQYNGVTEAELQGASDFIANGSVSYRNKDENPFIATLSGNYASDKIAILGASSNSAASSDVLFNNDIIEKGFITVDFVASKVFYKDFKISLVAKNLLDPNIDQTQNIVTRFTGAEGQNRIVNRYKKGRTLTLGLSYQF